MKILPLGLLSKPYLNVTLLFGHLRSRGKWLYSPMSGTPHLASFISSRVFSSRFPVTFSNERRRRNVMKRRSYPHQGAWTKATGPLTDFVVWWKGPQQKVPLKKQSLSGVEQPQKTNYPKTSQVSWQQSSLSPHPPSLTVSWHELLSATELVVCTRWWNCLGTPFLGSRAKQEKKKTKIKKRKKKKHTFFLSENVMKDTFV